MEPYDSNQIPLPRDNSFLVGYEETERELLHVISSNKLEGSWLISGVKGIGKATLAYRLARFILAKQNISKASSLFVDKTDNTFKLISSDSHPDLKVVERSLTDVERKKREQLISKGEALNYAEEKDRKRKNFITVDNIRDIGRFLSLTPFLGGHRVVIVDSADEMNDQASNALLKILEEPPRKAVMILVSHNQGKLNPTILSRCRKINLNKLDVEKSLQVIKNFIPDIAEDDAGNALLLANGSIGSALDIISSNGIDIVKKFVNIFAKLPYTKPYEINAFAEEIAGSDDNYHIAKVLLPDVIARAVKGKMKKNPKALENIIVERLEEQHLSIDDLLNIRSSINSNFELTDRLNLDKKVAVMDIFFKANEVIKANVN